MAIQTYLCRKHSQAHQGMCPECLKENVVYSEDVPPGMIYFINRRDLPTGEIDVEATAKASAVITNVGTR